MKFLIRCATEDDVEYIGENMTEEARREIRKTGEDPAEAVRFSARNSDICSILEMDGTPIMIYGVYGSLLGTSTDVMSSVSTAICSGSWRTGVMRITPRLSSGSV